MAKLLIWPLFTRAHSMTSFMVLFLEFHRFWINFCYWRRLGLGDEINQRHHEFYDRVAGILWDYE